MKLIFNLRKQPQKRIILLAQLTIVLYYLPYFILGENSNILIHDNLDACVTYVKILLNNDAAFSFPSKVVNQVLNGVPRYTIYGTYDISLIIFKIFGVYFGYVINKFFISFLGFWGMLLLLRKHFLPKSNSNTQYISVGVSLIFSLLPFWSYSASVLGLPFALFAFLNLRNNNKRFYNYLIIFLFAFYSSIIIPGTFFLMMLSVIFIFDVIKSRKINIPFFFGLVLLSFSYLLSHFPLIYGFLFESTERHRLEFYKESIGFWSAFHKFKYLFLEGQYHAHSLHKYFVLPVSVILVVFYKSFNNTVKLIFVFIILTSLYYGFEDHHLLKPLLEKLTIVPIKLKRFHFLHPMFWFILLAVVMSWSASRIKYSKVFIFSLLTLQFVYGIMHHEIWVNRNKPTFKEFYSEATFMKIKDVIDRPIGSYKVISVGLHPAVAQYNGLYTLDGYFANYSLKYKHEFRKVIRNELNRDESLKNYFDNWGSRCYAFSSELGKYFISNKRDSIQDLAYDFKHLKTMGGEYIISVAPINESINTEIELMERINYDASYWDVFLYKIK
jgi:hypothetical protein